MYTESENKKEKSKGTAEHKESEEEINNQISLLKKSHCVGEVLAEFQGKEPGTIVYFPRANPGKWNELIQDGKVQEIDPLTLDLDEKSHLIEKTEKKTENIKNIDLSKLKLHPGGDVKEKASLVVEPLGDKKYIYKLKDCKGIVKAQPKKKKKTKKSEKKKIIYWYLPVENHEIKLEGKPIDRLIYPKPNEYVLREWAEGDREAKPGPQLYDEIIQYLEIFLDLPAEHHYHIAGITALQSWLRPVLSSVFYLTITGAFGSGKSVLLEALEPIFYHGKLAGNMSEASLRRAIEAQKLSPLYDELDVETGVGDSIKYRTLRQGYRKGNPAIMANKQTHELEMFDPFGAKAFSMHGSIEKALRSRSIPISIAETEDHRLPVVNQFKEELGKQLSADLLIWYLTHIKQNLAQLSQLAQLARDIHTEGSAEEIRTQIYEKAIEGLTPEQTEFLKEYGGRATELAYICNIVTAAFKIDALDHVRKAFEHRRDLEMEMSEHALMGLLKELLVKKYHENKDKPTKKHEEQVFVLNQEVYEEFNEAIKLRGLAGISAHRFKEYKQELGFVDELNHKKIWIKEEDNSMLALIFDRRARRRLGISTEKDEEKEKEDKPSRVSEKGKSGKSSKSSKDNQNARVSNMSKSGKTGKSGKDNGENQQEEGLNVHDVDMTDKQ